MPDTLIAGIGHNNPPADPTPFEIVQKQILTYYDEIALYLDGDPITSEEMAADVSALKRLIQAEAATAEKMRVAEKEPHLSAGREIDARFKALSDKVKLAVATCNKVETPWLVAKQKAIADAAQAARDEANKKLAEAAAAIQSRDHTNLESMAAAEGLLKEAKQAERIATKAEKTTATTSNMAGRATGLRTYYAHELTSPKAFGEYLWTNHKAEYLEFLNMMAKRLVDGGKHNLDGVKVTEDKRAA